MVITSQLVYLYDVFIHAIEDHFNDTELKLVKLVKLFSTKAKQDTVKHELWARLSGAIVN